jgi:hypothetical protein
MFRLRFFPSLLITAFILIGFRTSLFADDGIPGNCENAAVEVPPNAFPRYEPQNSRLMLIDWTTGADIRILEANLVTERFQVVQWSPDCHYLAGAVDIDGHLDTVVWDVVNGGRLGAVEDAVGKPHHITWSPDSTKLVVETRKGAILWNIVTGDQLPLTTIWDGWLLRNFKWIHWDDRHGWLSTTAVDGTPLVYQLADGQPVPDAFEITYAERSPIVSNLPDCQVTQRGPDSISVNNNRHRVSYDSEAKRLSIIEGDNIYILDDNVIIPDRYPSNGRWSGSCRYYVTSIQRLELIRGQPVFDTVVYDVVERRRAVIFEDARNLPHPVIVSPYTDQAVITTRNGTYLWNFINDSRVLITDGVLTQSSYSPSITSFYQFLWDYPHGRIITVTVKHPNAVTVFDFNGHQVAFYPIEGVERVQLNRLADDPRLIIYPFLDNPRPLLKISLLDLESGQVLHLNTGTRMHAYPHTLISPDKRYFFAAVKGQSKYTFSFYTWDLQYINQDARPNFVSRAQNFTVYDYCWSKDRCLKFIDSTTIAFDERRWNILTGELLYIPAEYPGQPIISTSSRSSGFSLNLLGQRGRRSFRDNSMSCLHSNVPRQKNLFIHNDNHHIVLKDWNTGEVVLTLIENHPERFEPVNWSPNCRYIHLRYPSFPAKQFIWDSQSFGQIAVPIDNFEYIAWSPDDEQLLIRSLVPSQPGYFVWQPSNNALIPLQMNPAFIALKQVYWDYSRGLIFISDYYGTRVDSFDLHTGEMRATFAGSTAWDVYRIREGGTFDLSGDWLYIRGNETLTLFNLSTGENTQVWVKSLVISPGRLIVSPDSRYLVVVGEVIHVWDLAALPTSVPERLPEHYLRTPGEITEMHFIDNTTLEINLKDGAVFQQSVSLP